MTPEELLERCEELRNVYCAKTKAYNDAALSLSKEVQDTLFHPVIEMLIAYGNLQRIEQVLDLIDPENIGRG
jgi:hypothetical protein